MQEVEQQCRLLTGTYEKVQIANNGRQNERNHIRCGAHVETRTSGGHQHLVNGVSVEGKAEFQRNALQEAMRERR